MELLVPALHRGGLFLDATLGRAGHARLILDAAPAAQLVGIDRDPASLEESRTHLAPYEGRVRLVRDGFENLPAILERLGDASLRGVLFDLGVSSPQLDEASRGFGYRSEGPLDMRMDPSQSLTANAVVNNYGERDLERVISRYGEERFARRISRALVAARPVDSTTELADIVKNAIPAATRRTGGHPARRTFQALRIEVNDELGALERALPAAIHALEPSGRAVVISYHSLEDRIAKRTFAEAAKGCVCPPDFPICTCGAQAVVRVLTRRPLVPAADEAERNPRARSAKLRAVERLAEPVDGDAA
ncbi:MAG: 16S rRNA (cytosine(1402)-N(4))-methyltransferase RsmH [Actinomycetota bacterium]|nr:16S rRNA (cytosine(1402)-N(4))-methyltransferase RsmH [Actinomycetota bacterium]